MDKLGRIEPLTLALLKPFPLPKYVESLPNPVLQEFADLYALVAGYVKTLPQYKEFKDSQIQQLNTQLLLLNEIIVMLEEYNVTSEKIKEQLNKIKSLFQEFSDLETYQYQFLSSNFNPENLKAKFTKLMELNEVNSLSVAHRIRELPQDAFEEEFESHINAFKNHRKEYHLQREKLNRWNEERVAGFF